MPNLCQKCGAQLSEQSKFCPACGADTTQTAPPHTPQQQPPYQPSPYQTPPQYTQQPFQQPYQQQPYGYAQPPNAYALPQKEKHITFVFVSSLVFLIFFTIRFFTNIAAIGTYTQLLNTDASKYQNIYDAAMFSITTVVITFFVVLLLFIIATIARNKNKPAKSRVPISTVVLVFSLMALVAGIIYLISEISLLGAANEYPTEFNASSIFGSLIFDVVFIVFGIFNVVQSVLFMGFLKRKKQNEEAPPPASNVW